MPAIGPFIYEHGVNPINTRQQFEMLAVFRHSVLDGREWLAANGGESFTSGLAAMPSLHNAGALLFLLFALNYGKPLVPPLALAFGFIVITSVASRWHYLADLPVGWLLGWVSFRFGERFGDAPSSVTVIATIELQPYFDGLPALAGGPYPQGCTAHQHPRAVSRGQNLTSRRTTLPDRGTKSFRLARAKK